eukprot:239035-Rhodomonas_salina.1
MAPSLKPSRSGPESCLRCDACFESSSSRCVRAFSVLAATAPSDAGARGGLLASLRCCSTSALVCGARLRLHPQAGSRHVEEQSAGRAAAASLLQFLAGRQQGQEVPAEQVRVGGREARL